MSWRKAATSRAISEARAASDGRLGLGRTTGIVLFADQVPSGIALPTGRSPIVPAAVVKVAGASNNSEGQIEGDESTWSCCDESEEDELLLSPLTRKEGGLCTSPNPVERGDEALLLEADAVEDHMYRSLW